MLNINAKMGPGVLLLKRACCFMNESKRVNELGVYLGAMIDVCVDDVICLELFPQNT